MLKLPSGSTWTQNHPWAQSGTAGEKRGSACGDGVSRLDPVFGVWSAAVFFVPGWFTRRKERERERGPRGWRGGFLFAISQFHSRHKAAATPGLVHGSICLILKTEEEQKDNHIALWLLQKQDTRAVYSGLYRWPQRERDKEELTPLVADQHWTRSMPGAVVSLPAGKQIVPEHRAALERTQTASNRG